MTKEREDGLPHKQVSMSVTADMGRRLTVAEIPEGYLLRGYEPGDEEGWLELLHLGGFTHWHLDSVRDYLEDAERRVGSRVVVLKGKIVAATFASREDPPGAAGMLDYVVSHPEHRGKGLGRRVCAAVMEFFVDAGYERISLLTDDFKLPAIKVYLSLGFEPVMTREDMPARWDAIMEKLASRPAYRSRRNSKGMEPRRHLRLEGTHNVRDLGGYPTQDGHSTRWRTVLRADSLHRLTPASQKALADYGIRTVIDLRRTAEVLEMPDAVASSPDFAYYHQDLEGDALTLGEKLAIPLESRKGAKFWAENYTGWLDLRRTHIVETLATLASPGILPALVHCAGGKDRTGLMAALILALARVPVETIVEDYALSAPYLISRYLNEHALSDVATDGYTWREYQRDSSPHEAMLETLRYLEERYGGAERYALGAGMTQEQVETLRHALVK